MTEDLEVCFHLKPRSVLSRERLDGELVAIDFESGNYFSFDGSAADIFWLLDNEIAFAHWASILGMHYTDLPNTEELRSQLRGFLDELVNLGLVQDGAPLTEDSVPLPSDCDRGSWQRPSTHTHSELADLLVIDPIHDTGDDGWPETKSK